MVIAIIILVLKTHEGINNCNNSENGDNDSSIVTTNNSNNSNNYNNIFTIIKKRLKQIIFTWLFYNEVAKSTSNHTTCKILRPLRKMDCYRIEKLLYICICQILFQSLAEILVHLVTRLYCPVKF